MIKICFVTTVHDTLDSFVLDLAEYLHGTNEYEISFACKKNEEFERRLPSYIHFYPITIERGANSTVFTATRELKWLFQKEKFDIVQFSTPNASFCASTAARQTGIPVRLYCQWGLAYVGFQGWKRTVFKALEKKTCQNATVIEPDSQGNLNFSVEEGLYPHSKAHVIGKGSASGVNLKKFNLSEKPVWRHEIRKKYSIADSDLVFGFVGRLDRDKGINELLAAYNQLKNKHSHLFVIGPEDKKNTLDQHLYQASLKDPSIVYTGEIGNVEQYLSAMDIFVLPSYREGFGSVVIEAEAMGLPVIVTDIPGPTEAMRNGLTGIVVKKADISTLQQAMKKLAENQELCRQYGQSSAVFAKEGFEQTQLFEKIDQDRRTLVKE